MAAKTHQNDLFNELNRLLKCSADQTAQSFSNKYYKRIFKSNSWYTAELIEQIKIKNTSKERADVDTKSNEVKQIKRIAYNNYRNLLRKNKQRAKHNEFIELDKLRCSDTDKFWRRIKSKLEKKVIVEADIEQLKNEYEMLFTSKIVDDSSIKADIAEAEMKEFALETEKNIYECNITIDQVRETIKQLGNGKSVGIAGASNEMFKYCTNYNVIKAVRLLIETTFRLGTVPENSNSSIIKPLLKDPSKASDDVANTRPISISDAYCTIFGKILLKEIDKVHKNHDKQFGFKGGSSCAHATFMVTEAARISRRRGLKTYLCAIDASKAFDKVNRFILFKKLLNVSNPMLIRALMGYYSVSKAIVSNNGLDSNSFTTTIGLKQGCCLSPRLFSIYVEDIIGKIESKSQGISMIGVKADIILYADDIVLMSNSALGLQAMLKIVEEFGAENEIKFNVTKTNILIIQPKIRNCAALRKESALDSKLKFRLDGKLIPIVNKIKYLGTWLSNSLNISDHLDEKINGQAVKISQLEKIGFKYTGLSADTKAFYYKTYVRPYLFYGLDAFTFKPRDLKRLKATEGNTIKRALGLPTVLWSTELFLALNLHITKILLEKQLLGLMLRLSYNKITRKIMNGLIKLSNYQLESDSIMNRVTKIIGPVKTVRELATKCGQAIQTIKNSFEDIKKTDEAVIFVSELLKTNKRAELIELL